MHLNIASLGSGKPSYRQLNELELTLFAVQGVLYTFWSSIFKNKKDLLDLHDTAKICAQSSTNFSESKWKSLSANNRNCRDTFCLKDCVTSKLRSTFDSNSCIYLPRQEWAAVERRGKGPCFYITTWKYSIPKPRWWWECSRASHTHLHTRLRLISTKTDPIWEI